MYLVGRGPRIGSKGRTRDFGPIALVMGQLTRFMAQLRPEVCFDNKLCGSPV